MEKKKFVIFSLVTTLCLLSANEILTYSTGAPARHTGAPNEQSCGACHSSNTVNTGDGSITVQVMDEGTPVSSYKEGVTYTIILNLSAHSGQQSSLSGGFEITAINGAGASVGNWNFDSGTMKMVQGFVQGKMRRYVTHITAANFSKVNGISWEIEWTAPIETEGVVNFYVAGNSANNNMANTGDYIYTASLALPAFSTVGVEDLLASTTAIRIMQNPVRERLNLEISTTRPDVVKFSLTNLAGQVINLPGKTSVAAGKNHFSFDINGISPGIYMLRSSGEHMKFCQKIMVKGKGL